MKQKNAIISALVITLLFGLAMGAIGINAMSNSGSTLANQGSASSAAAQIILATPVSSQSSISIQPAVSASASGG